MGEVRIEKLVYGGAGLGRQEGQVVLVPFVLPGEEVRAETTRDRGDLLEARATEILEPAPERIVPACEYYARCGGCHYQHAGYEFELAQKAGILKETLARVGRVMPPENIDVAAGPEWGYRNRSQFHLRDGGIGYLEPASHTFVAVERCPISSPRLNEAVAALREMAGDERFPGFLRTIELFTNEDQVQINVLDTAGGRRVGRHFFEWCEERIAGAASGAIDYAAQRETYRDGYRSFFQVNRFLIDKMVDAALAGAEGEWALELYAGVGLFSLPLARRFRRVTAVESGTSAWRDLGFNAERAGLVIEAMRAPADLFLETVDSRPDFVLADPPRAGLGKGVVPELLRLRPPKLAIVSCDPATLARDVSALLAGGYQVDSMTLVDLFPRTYHIESVSHLSLA